MMFLLGYALYIMAVISYLFVDTISELINNAFLLAEGISTIVFSIYLYPLFIASYQMIRRKNSESSFKFLSKQTTLSASVAVSMGLIGTFLGLTQMISAIAASTSGSDNISEQMGMLMEAISSALSAMAYAFLTSILGVAVSVLLLVSLNFWSFFYVKTNKKTSFAQLDSKDNNQKLAQLIEINLSLHEKLLRQKEQEEAWLKIANSFDLIQKQQNKDRETLINNADAITKHLKSCLDSNNEIVKNLNSINNNQCMQQNQIIKQLKDVNNKSNTIISLNKNATDSVDKSFLRIEKVLVNLNSHQKRIKRSLCLQTIYLRKVVRDFSKERTRIKNSLKAIIK